MDALDGIDTSAIEELMQIRAEEEELAARQRRMGELRGGVSPIVYARVEQDYRTRVAALTERARPLEARARAEYQRLAGIHHEVDDALGALRLEAEERDFRHRLGEYDDATFAARTQESAERLAACERDLAATEALRQRFLAAFPDREALERSEPTAPPPTLPAAAPETPGDEGVTRPMSAAGALDDAPPAAPAPGLEPPPELPTEFPSEVPSERPMPPVLAFPGAEPEEDGTVILPWRAAPPAAPPTELGTTMVLPSARLIGQEEGLEEEFHLGPTTFVGRTSECQVRIARPAVSRRHARLDLAPDGSHVLADLGSENGTWVNGERITEQRLRDGDLIAFGTVRFLYKAT